MLITLFVVVATAIMLSVAGLLSNRPPLTDPPGVIRRLLLYTSRNVAETGDGAPLPELAAIRLRGGTEGLAQAVARVCRELGWRDVAIDDDGKLVRATVVTPVLRFSDDVRIRLLPGNDGRVEARVRSASRVGRGDLGANARHVMDLREALERAGLMAEAGG